MCFNFNCFDYAANCNTTGCAGIYNMICQFMSCR